MVLQPGEIMSNTIDFNSLLEAGVHFGHGQEYWNSKMAPYLYGVRRKVHIINLLKTRVLLQKAADYAKHIAGGNGKILYVATKRQAQELIASEANRVSMPYVNRRWPGGMLTNFKTILQSVDRMKYLETFLDSEEAQVLKKKERLSLERDLSKLKASFNGIRDMTSLPDCLFVIDVGQEHIAVREANKLGIPVVGVVDTNCSPEGIDYIIPGNDDSHKAIHLYLNVITDAIAPEVNRIKLEEEKRAVVMKGKEITVVKKKTSGKDAETETQKVESENAQTESKENTQTEASSDATEVKKAKKIVKVSVDQARKALEKKKEDKATEDKPKAVKKTKSKSKTTDASETKKKSTKAKQTEVKKETDSAVTTEAKKKPAKSKKSTEVKNTDSSESTD